MYSTYNTVSKNDKVQQPVIFSNIEENQNPLHMHIPTFCRTRKSLIENCGRSKPDK
jgi:hypothetical protein